MPLTLFRDSSMKYLVFLPIALMILSCGADSADLLHLNGYWEISEVRLADGTKKEYKISETVDMFQIDGSTGVRKKVKPQFDGKFAETGLVEKFDIVEESGKIILQYSTGFDTWKEEIIRITEDELVVMSIENVTYHYKRAVPFTIK